MEKMKTISMTVSSDKLFFGESGHGVARYDKNRYPIFNKLNTQMQSYFWRPVEIDMSQERKDFESMTEAEQFVFTSNLQRQIILDTVQGRAPATTFLPVCTDPAVENCILTWSFFESIHSESYTHIIRAVYPDPSVVFDNLPNVSEVVVCAKSISKAYDAMLESPSKENLWRALMAANALEGLRFFPSFAGTFSFGKRGKVEGSAKAVRFIARDESQHLALVHHILKVLPKDDPEFLEISQDLATECAGIFDEAAEQEYSWISYLFSKGSVIGLSEKILVDYVKYLLPKRKYAAGLTKTRSNLTHPLPWIEAWLANRSVQYAPQEAERSSYLTGSVVDDLVSAKLSLKAG